MSVELSCEISYSGQLLVIAAQVPNTAPSGGFDQLASVTQVTGNPTLLRNGTAVTLYGPIWNDGSQVNGNPGVPQANAMVAYYLTGGPVSPSDTMTVNIPQDFINTASGTSGVAVTGAAVTNYTGQLEGPFGHMPGLNVTPTTGAGLNLGQPAIDYQTTNFIWANQMFRSAGWGGNATATYDQYGYPVTWNHTTNFHTRCYGVNGGSDLDNRGWPNEAGTWSLVWNDPAAGTGLATTVTPTLDPNYGTISIGSPTVTGTVTILPFTIGYVSNPQSWFNSIGCNVGAPANNLGGTDGLAHWALGKGPFMVPPNAADGSQVSSTFLNALLANPYKLNPNVALQLSSGGKVASHLRAMESTCGSGGEANAIYTIDMPDARDASWEFFPTLRSFSVEFQFVRFVNTDPAKGSVASGGDGTYNWAPSTRCYGPQSAFALSDGVTTPITATLTSGSNNITITTTPFPAIMAGGYITGTGVPANSRLAYFNASTGAATLDIPNGGTATASGSQSLTLHNPGYVPLAAADDGGFMINGYGQQNWAVIEMRSTLPHGLTSYQNPVGTTNHNAVSITNVGNYDPQSPQGPLYVTGPYTVAFPTPAGNGLPNGPTNTGFQVVNSTTEYNFTANGGWVVTINVPFQNTGALPPEALVAACADLGCPRAWVTLPGWGVDELYTQLGTRCASTANSSIQVILERVDEPWDGATPFYLFLIGNIGLTNLYDSLPNGTVVYPNFTTSSSVTPAAFGLYGMGAHTLYSGHAVTLFKSAWTTAGKSGSNIKHVLNAQFGDSAKANVLLGAAQQWGVTTDYLAMAPYVGTPNCTAIVNAFSATGGNMSLPAMNDYARLYHVCDYGDQSQYQTHQASIQAWGQPTTFVVARDSSPATGGNIALGGHVCSLTWLDTAGHETTIGQSACSPFSTTLIGGAATYILVQMPVTPPWVHQVNFYTSVNGYADQRLGTSALTLAAGAGGVAPGTWLQIGTMPTDSAQAPPTTNLAAAAAGTPPVLCGYEGGEPITVPQNVSGQVALNHDVRAHPSRWLNVWTHYATNQIGCQWAPGSGMAFATWYGGWASGPNIPPPLGNDFNEYLIYNGPGQPAGLGTSNQYATSRAGSTGPGDGQDHNAGVPLALGLSGVQVRNVSPGGYGLQQWIAGSSTAPSLAVNPTSASATDGGAGVSITATLTNSSAALSAAISPSSGAGTISTTTPTSGTPFTYTPPASGTGTATVTVTDTTDSLSGQCVISYAPAPVAPTVTSTTPTNGATAVAITTTVTVIFSESMQSGTLSLTLNGTSVPLTSYNNSTFTALFTPSSSLANGTAYSAVANGTGTNGLAMASPYSWSFTAVDPVPTILATTPADGTTNVAIGVAPTATFSEAVSSGSITFTVTPQGGSAVSGTTTYNSGTHVATFTPTSSLANSTQYAATVSATAPDGTPMAAPFTWHFTTQAAAPTVTSTTPASGATLVNPAAAISVTFSEPMTPATLSLSLSPAANLSAPSYNAATNTATWKPPASGLAFGTSYTATANATGTNGLSLASPYSWSFSTHQAPPTGQAVVVPVAYTFTGAINASSMVVTLKTNGNNVSGSAAYDSTNFAITFTPTSPLTAGSKYILTISGLKTTGGASITTITYPVIPGAWKLTGWTGGVGTASGGP